MNRPLLSCFVFSIFFVAVESTKILHVWLNAGDFPLVFFLLCLPTFFLTDVALLTTVFLLLRRKVGLLSLVGRVVACLIRYVLNDAFAGSVSCFGPPTRSLLVLVC